MLALTVDEARHTQSRPIDPTQHAVTYNPTYEQLWAPMYGPAHPYAKDGIAQGMRNHKLGFVEDASIDSFVLDEQYNTFHKYGYAADTTDNNYIGDLDALEKHDGVSVYNMPQQEQKKRKLEKRKETEEDDEMAAGGDPAEVNNRATDTWLMKKWKSLWAGKKEGVQTELIEEQKKYAEEYAKKKKEKGNAGEKKGEHVADKSTFHVKEGITRAGLGLQLPKMLKQLTIIVIYQRGWFTLGAGMQRVFQPFGSSANMDT